MAQFQDQVILITGGSSGIGRAAALAFAREGARVVISARGADRANQVVREIENVGGVCAYIPADLAKPADVLSLVEGTVARFGRIDCAFNNAASTEGLLTATADLSEEQYDSAMAVNLKSVWLCMKLEIRQMLAQEPRGGAIVNTSSVNGLGGCRMAALYAAAKAGVISLSKSAAMEYAQQGIRINALVAGAFRTPMLDGAIAGVAGGDPARREAVETQYQTLIPMGRIADPAEAAAIVLWLCSPAASYVTGHSMIADGGLSTPFR